MIISHQIMINKIEENGFWGYCEEAFCKLYNITENQGRILLAEVGGNHEAPHGISFWICYGNHVLIIGLWSGRLYGVYPCDDPLNICIQMLNGSVLMSGKTPSILPSGFLEENNLQLIEILELDGKNIPPDSRELEFNSLVNKMSGKAVFDRDENGFVHWELKTAKAFTRISSNINVSTSLAVVFEDGIRETKDEVCLLQAIYECSNFELIDESWGNRIKIDDPYYNFTPGIERPDEPLSE